MWKGEHEFNVANDLDAFDALCDTKELEFHIMLNNVNGLLKFHSKNSIDRLEGEKGIGDFIRVRWIYGYYGNDSNSYRTMWDVALIYAITNPEWAPEIMVDTPPGSIKRKVNIYTTIDDEKMEEEFWRSCYK